MRHWKCSCGNAPDSFLRWSLLHCVPDYWALRPRSVSEPHKHETVSGELPDLHRQWKSPFWNLSSLTEEIRVSICWVFFSIEFRLSSMYSLKKIFNIFLSHTLLISIYQFQDLIVVFIYSTLVILSSVNKKSLFFSPRPGCVAYCSFIINLRIIYSESPNFLLQYCVVCHRNFAFPYKL